MKFRFCLTLLCCSLGVYAQGQGPGDHQGPPEIVPHRTNPANGGAPTAGSTGTITPTIRFRGGPVMTQPTPYLIWYGNWNQNNGSDTPSGQQIVRDFMYGLSGSNYYLTNRSYSGVSGYLNPSVETSDNYSQGSSLSDSQIGNIVANAIANGNCGPTAGDPNGIYLVLTSSDVSETSGFCSRYCGWHTWGTLSTSGANIKYSFVGNANRCLNACAAQTVGPNGNAGVDAMVSVIAHETEETNTDPNLNAWYNARGSEDADMCAWTFGSHQFLVNGAYANMTLPALSTASRSYLIQRELDSGSKCYVDYVQKTQ